MRGEAAITEHILSRWPNSADIPYLERHGLKIGTIVDATILEAPSSTKNSKGGRDLEMHQVRKGSLTAK